MADTNAKPGCPRCWRPVAGDVGVCPHCGARFARFGPVKSPNAWTVAFAVLLFGFGGMLAASGGGCGLLSLSYGESDGLVVAAMGFGIAAVGVAICMAARRMCVPRR